MAIESRAKFRLRDNSSGHLDDDRRLVGDVVIVRELGSSVLWQRSNG